MALSAVPMIPRDAVITIEDNTGGTPLKATVTYEDGDFSFDPVEEGYMSTVILKDRGMHYAIRKTEEQDLSFTFSAHATDFSDATEKTLWDVVMKTGAFASGVSTFGSNADAWTTKLTFTVEATNYGLSADHVVTFTKCRCSISFAEGIPGKFTIKGMIFNPSSTISVT
ncbi:hypothetical protein [Janthinobacterium sp.]|uniref:hypothetical protein n=1 Tax=Janthinobacterium sp. TaxID=1871054 RepID=UPI0025BBE9CB|nr:hypothetical protein [Janthinobacterium sp.]NBV19949.1 hypothetical protein [Janthinobacterium sp.]